MGDKTGIQWTDATWNPIVGCSVVSPGCTNCYAMKMAARIERMSYRGEFREELGETINVGVSHYEGTTQPSKGGPVWTGKVAQAPEHILTAPLRWKRPRKIFVNSMGDLFHHSVPDAWIDRVFAVMALAPQHTFQVLTKRSKRMREYCTYAPHNRDDLIVEEMLRLSGYHSVDSDAVRRRAYMFLARFPLPNVHLGVSAEDQTRADERIPDLLATPAAVRFVSAEPLLGSINFRSMSYASGEMLPECMNVNGERCSLNALEGRTTWPSSHYVSPTIKRRSRIEGGELYQSDGENVRLDWIIVGGESGKGARPMHPAWARSIRDQCKAGGVPFFFKQWGEFKPLGAIFCDDDTDMNAVMNADEKCSFILDGAGYRWDDGDGQPPNDSWMMVRVGKHRAGRLLDGVEHNEMPR